MRKLFLRRLPYMLITLGVLLQAVSCTKNLHADTIQIDGKWAKVDDVFMTSEYVEFGSDNMKSFVSESRKLVYDGIVWNSTQNDFEKKGSEHYSVHDGMLIVAGKSMGKLSIDKDTMTVGNTRYISIDEFKSEQYSRIEIQTEEPVKCGYTGGSCGVSYEIDNPLKWNSISAESMVDWISSVKCESGTLSFVVDPSPEKEKRNGSILLSYPNADDVSVTVSQTNLSSVKIDRTLLDVDYRSGEYNVSYTIENPSEGGSLTYSTGPSWISDIRVDAERIFITLDENNTGNKRTGSILFSYPEADNVELVIVQSYSAPEIIADPESVSCDYAGGDFSFSYSVENPREGEEITVSTESDWISNLKQTDNKVSFTVTENNIGSSREGVIVMRYGDYTQEYRVLQSYSAPEIIADPGSVSCDYAGGDFSFSYSIQNPRKGESLQVICQDPWITDISVSSDRVSFRVIENQTSLFRQSKLSLNYANIQEEVSVYQEMNYDKCIDLSSSGTANCYIVSSAGGYKFPAVKGNGNESVGSVSSVFVLWESFGTGVTPQVGDLISYARYSDDWVYFSTDENYFREGNAVIAAKAASGNILWSWHIWLTDKPEDQVYNNGAGTMMDRNLGALSATPGDVGALGLLYQWGRKDPFLGSSSISSNTRAKSTLSWRSPVPSTEYTGTIDYAVANPTTFIMSNIRNNDWYYTGSSRPDNTRWESSKTIYDPCPPGYRVPDGGDSGVWSKAFGSSSDFNENAYDNANEGFNFGSSGKGSKKLSSSVNTCWYPAAGCLEDDGSLYSVGNYGYCWSSSPDGNVVYNMNFNFFGNVSPSNSYSRAYGYSVRCLKE